MAQVDSNGSALNRQFARNHEPTSSRNYFYNLSGGAFVSLDRCHCILSACIGKTSERMAMDISG